MHDGAHICHAIYKTPCTRCISVTVSADFFMIKSDRTNNRLELMSFTCINKNCMEGRLPPLLTYILGLIIVAGVPIG